MTGCIWTHTHGEILEGFSDDDG
ncbi:uncharacterized protein G2W53_026790 [Senna tora]|uniref:Uncharacterized protein n=1 Tax=Senna tora TaxID=362788 RepID=A0A834TI32_9FABA|nr:uncharacterized protein G2W53_026790 [Senna tora]